MTKANVSEMIERATEAASVEPALPGIPDVPASYEVKRLAALELIMTECRFITGDESDDVAFLHPHIYKMMAPLDRAIRKCQRALKK